MTRRTAHILDCIFLLMLIAIAPFIWSALP